MAAIITTPFRIRNAENFKADVTSSNVYIGIGKADAWSTNVSDTSDTVESVPGDHIDDAFNAQQNLIGLKKVGTGNISHVVRRIDWADGKVFTAYDSSNTNLYNDDFYCLTSEFKVYKCIIGGPSGSTVQPNHTTADITGYGDGYYWKYMYTIIAADSEAFLTNSFMPVKTLLSDPGSNSADAGQWNNQQASASSSTVQGIERLVITNGGSGYSASDNFNFGTLSKITGDGTNAAFTNGDVTVTNGAITSIEINAPGSGYTVADVVIGSDGPGANATARAVIAPVGGHGVDPVSELGGFFIAINTQLTGVEVTADNDFRQVSIIKDPKKIDGSAITATTVQTLKYLHTTTSITNFLPDMRVQGNTSGAVAYVAFTDTTNNRIYFYQNEKTGYGTFQNSEVITSTPGSHTATLQSTAVVTDTSAGGPYDVGTGDVLFLENRQPINRSATQIEDIKCIIEF